MSPVSFAENVRFLAWRKHWSPIHWGDVLSKRVPPLGEARSWQLMRGESPPTPDEVEAIGQAWHVDPQDLVFARLADEARPQFCLHNLQRMFKTAPSGAKRQIAEAADVHPSTISRWLRGQVPERAARIAIRDYFGLSLADDLIDAPLFLRIEPVTVAEKREWVRQRLQTMRTAEVASLWPALEKLLA